MAKSKESIQAKKVLTEEFRVSHPHVFKPTKVNKSDTKESYTLEMLFDKTKIKLGSLQAALKAAVVEKWGDDKNEWPVPLKMPIRDGDKPYGKKKEIKEEHKGMWVVRASSSAEFSKPYVLAPDGKTELTKESELYPGCYARAALMAHAYTFADKDGVKFILDGVQFIRHGKALTSKAPPDQMFGAIEGADDMPAGDDDSFGLGADESNDEESFM